MGSSTAIPGAPGEAAIGAGSGTDRRVTPATQEIRLATTMTGGVSLAIWMGGVTRELDLLAQASRWRSGLTGSEDLPARSGAPAETSGGAPAAADASRLTDTDKVRLLYLHLIDLLDVTVEIDVLSGTSAGGINAALLAYSRVTGKDLGGLRQLWLDLGALLSLLRDPADRDVPSLLLGDGQMLAQLARELPLLADAPSVARPDPADKPLTTLFVTTTLLNGETSRFTDSYGTLVQDVDHHGLFRFTETQLTEANAGALALAARSSASFPGAFEPSFIPFTDPTPANAPVPVRPAMAEFSDITRSHWAADGGVLDNQPIGPLLQTVFDRPADRVVRRVLLYVVPSAGTAPDLLLPQPGDDASKPYGLLEGMLRDIGAVRGQSIAADLRAIRDHNDRVGVRTDMRLQLAAIAARLQAAQAAPADANGPAAAAEPAPAEPARPLGDNAPPADGATDGAPAVPAGTSGSPAALLTESLLADYRAREAAAVAQPLVEALMRQLSTWPAASTSGAGDRAGRSSIPATWQDALAPGSGAEQACRESIASRLSDRWGQAIPAGFAGLARYDRPAYDGAKAVALSMLRTAYPLALTPELQSQLAVAVQALHDAYRPPPRPDLRQFVTTWCQADQIRGLELSEAAATIAERYVEQLAEPAPGNGSAGGPGGASSAAAYGAGSAADRLAEAWQKLGAAFAPDAAGVMLSNLASGTPPGPGAAAVAGDLLSARSQLRTYLGYLRIADGAECVAARLFALFAAQRAMLPVDAEVEQLVELIQVSADTRTTLDPGRGTAASKLTGEQLHHFGAFFKQSWRANDWMWGRLDGAGWLVHLLLDPRRIQTAASSQGDRKTDWFLGKLEALGAAPLATGRPGDPGIRVTPDSSPKPVFINAMTVRDELAFLDRPGSDIPVSLPLTAMWVARAWQLHIAADELPTVAETVVTPRNDGPKSRPGDEYKSAAESAWAKDVTQAEKAGRLLDSAEGLLRRCPVPGEKLAGEMGSPLMIRTVAKAAATGAAALSSAKQIPAVARPAISWARTMSLAGYRMTTKIKPVPRWLIGAGLVLLVVGVLAAIQQSVLFGLGGLAIASAGAYLIVIGAWQMSRLALGALLSTTIVLAAGSLTLPVVRRYLFGSTVKDTGWLGRQVHWIGTSPWHPLIVLGIIGLAGSLTALLPRAFRRR